MSDTQPAYTPVVEPPPQTWESLLDTLKASPEPKFAEGPWSTTYLPPMVHRSETFSFEPLSPRVRLIDHAAYMSSIEHLNQAQEWGWPDAGIDQELTWLDMWGEWLKFGRNERFGFAALTHSRDSELGCAYLWQNEDSTNPYEADFYVWVTEDAMRNDLDIALVKEFLAWIDADWAFNRIVHVTPQSYERGLEVAAAAGLTRVDSWANLPTYASFEWVRS